jgi:hypothetical protein
MINVCFGGKTSGKSIIFKRNGSADDAIDWLSECPLTSKPRNSNRERFDEIITAFQHNSICNSVRSRSLDYHYDWKPTYQW